MRVLVTGATGRLGTAVVPELLQAGMAVRAMSRTARTTSGEVEWVEGDLARGTGIAEAVGGMDVIVHLASAPYRGRRTERVELDGTRRLLDAAANSGVAHVVYLSIVGVDRAPWGYFGTKLRGEAVVRDSAVPHSIVRATQFHEFVDQALRMVARTGVLVVDPGITGQPVDVRDVAGYVRQRVADGPSKRIEDYGGPDVLDLDSLVRRWLDARGTRRPVMRVRFPGALGAAFRGGHLTTRTRPRGTRTWQHYLDRTYRGTAPERR